MNNEENGATMLPAPFAREGVLFGYSPHVGDAFLRRPVSS
jgi:hypothetical protein